MAVVGVDLGSQSTKVVILEGELPTTSLGSTSLNSSVRAMPGASTTSAT